MVLSNRRKAQLIIITTFLLGIVVGGSGQYLLSRNSAAPRANLTEQIISDLTREVGLNNEQRAKIESIIDETAAQYDMLKDRYRPEFDAIRDESRRRVRALLTVEQQSLYDQWNREQDALKKKKKEQQGSSGK